MNGWMVFNWAAGVLGDLKSTSTDEVSEGVKDQLVSSDGTHEYVAGLNEIVLEGTIKENTFIFSMIAAGLMSPETITACGAGCKAMMSNIIRRVVSAAATSNIGTLSKRYSVALSR